VTHGAATGGLVSLSADLSVIPYNRLAQSGGNEEFTVKAQTRETLMSLLLCSVIDSMDEGMLQPPSSFCGNMLAGKFFQAVNYQLPDQGGQTHFLLLSNVF
jgi:hypothetical protein